MLSNALRYTYRIFSGDKLFLEIIAILTFGGIAIFSSATLGLLARANSNVGHIAVTQIIFGLGVGIIAFISFRLIPYAWFRKASPWIFGITLLLTLAVFIPGFGEYSHGATRWLNLRFITIQPVEFLKIGIVFFIAKFIADNQRKITNYKYSVLSFVTILIVPLAVLFMQKNTSSILLIGVTSLAMYFAAGAPWRHAITIILIGVAMFSLVLVAHPYARQRVTTFLNPASDPSGSGYQIRQSLIAIGNGGVGGRGFGESVQKFNYLPEPDGDSVFAVFAEECGFIGATILVLLFFGLSARGIAIAGKSRDFFGGLVAFGFAWLLAFQAFVNMGAMLGLMPLTGLPLPFISHGGTALVVALAEAGFILNIASHRRTASHQ
ncbi:Cell division protein FtsW [hydrothermal vent metagenome]|uniref:peptidoglycan glycosyltransferase n=1 Tax=hydrothermal vent metagenome TaxID=652676 RepID=A0A3B0VK15_9ZZZZ